ncbi:hypothetical protein A2U01_0068922, partial [Trifolium medium]|nr:hypothetical protein [Trifolium medium]
SGKVVASVVTSAKPAKSTKKIVSIGPKKQWSKVVPPSETKKKGLKRKAVESSDSDFEETIVVASSGTSRKTFGGKKIPINVPHAPLDNVSFHLEDGSS